MNLIGSKDSWNIYWLDWGNFENEDIPQGTWVCLLTANAEPDWDRFKTFVDKSMEFGIADFKAHGTYGEAMHDFFDWQILDLEMANKSEEPLVMTTWHTNESLADVFWQTLNVAILPDAHDRQNVNVLCANLDGMNSEVELTHYLNRFKRGWLPSE